jgi:2,3-bisphosphoglycerate-independent phosphoglycerate mutase
VKAIEKVDAELLGEVLAGLRQGYASWRLLLLPDHPTPLALRTHTDEPVPFLIADYHRTAAGGGINVFSEAAARKTGVFIADGWRLLDYFINRGHSGPQAARKS